MPFFEDLHSGRKSDTKLNQLRKYDDVAISVEKLKELGFKEYTILF